ncbi:MAG: 30S ribosomal protein S4 [Clostridiales bacterium]|nr:30S ribosomal protein S4 [Clostridiales bacterium]MDY4654930.1 30S ribosomal protein S4 [Eubacteriales bacterium]
MAKYTGPDCRLCRREGCKLFLKGDKCYSEKCTFIKRQTPPGIHGASRKKPTPYSIQLREKQKVKRIYNLTEKQFHKYYELAEKMRGATGENMLVLLERRLDNVVYRMGVGVSRAQSRQLVNHGHITVNGKRVNIPSYLIKAGDVIAVKENKQEIPFFTELKNAKISNSLKWLEFNPATLSGSIIALPTREDIDMSIAEHMIVELYSK